MEGAFSCCYQHSVYIIYWQEQIRLVVQQVALLTHAFHVMVNGVSSPPTLVQQPLVGQGPLIEASRTHSDTSHSVGRLWISDQPIAATST